MTVRNIISRALFLTFIGITIVLFLCVNEILYGSGLTHPIWDSTYNWFPLFRDILYISFVGALLSKAASINNKHKSLTNTVIKGAYQYGH
jgi:hypothetical protein